MSRPWVDASGTMSPGIAEAWSGIWRALRGADTAVDEIDDGLERDVEYLSPYRFLDPFERDFCPLRRPIGIARLVFRERSATSPSRSTEMLARP